MLWWVRVAALGVPVVPLVNWMLIGSSNWRSVSSSFTRVRAASSARLITSPQVTVPVERSSPAG